MQELPTCCFCQGASFVQNYTLPRAIKEKKKKEEGVGHSGVEKEKGEVGQVGFLDSRGEEKKIRF